MKKIITIVLTSATLITIMLAHVWAAAYFGIEEKSWLVQNWNMITGGGIGLVFGIIIALIYGGFGVVTGGLFFGIHALGICILSTLSGLGMGSISHVIMNPSSYYFNWYIIIPIILVGLLLSNKLSTIVWKTMNLKKTCR